jgi:putative transposase
MARPLRLEVPGGVYHLVARGNERRPIFVDDVDRSRFLERLGAAARRQEWQLLGWCLMGNHYHLVVEISAANLARGMRVLNGSYAQWFNRRHGRVGHLFQGRYGSVLVQTDAHLQTVLAYVALNPVRAKLCASPRKWRWSSHRATLGLEAPGLLALDTVLGYLGSTRSEARRIYLGLTESEESAPSVSHARIAVDGDDRFVEAALAGAAISSETVRAHTLRPRPSLEALLGGEPTDEALAGAYRFGYSMPCIARHLRLHPSTISKRLKRHAAATAPSSQFTT